MSCTINSTSESAAQKTQPLIFIPIQWTNSGKNIHQVFCVGWFLCYNFGHGLLLVKWVLIIFVIKLKYNEVVFILENKMLMVWFYSGQNDHMKVSGSKWQHLSHLAGTLMNREVNASDHSSGPYPSYCSRSWSSSLPLIYLRRKMLVFPA